MQFQAQSLCTNRNLTVSGEKPVGTVFICWAARPDRVHTEQFLFDGDREAVRRQSVLEALGGLARFLREETG